MHRQPQAGRAPHAFIHRLRRVQFKQQQLAPPAHAGNDAALQILWPQAQGMQARIAQQPRPGDDAALHMFFYAETATGTNILRTRNPLWPKGWRALPSLTYEAQGDSLLDYNFQNYYSQLRGRHG